MIDKKFIGKIIKTQRINNGYTQEVLSEKIGISKNYLSKIERGLSLLNVETFLKMAEILKFNLEDFGIGTINTNNKYKKEIITLILSLSDKEAEVYSNLVNNINIAIKKLK